MTTGDVTGRGRAEETLSHQAQLLANVNDAVVSANKNFIWTSWNPAAERMYGWKEDEVIGRPLGQILHPEFVGIAAVDVYRILWETGHWRGEVIQYNKDGRKIYTEANAFALRDENGDITGYVGVDRDITERKRAEEELRESEERLKILFESAPDAYYLNDLEGTFVDGNRAAEEMTGYERKELIGMSFLELDLLPEDQIPKAAALLARNSRGEPTGPDELTLNRKDGKQVPLEIRTFPVSINGEPRVLGIARDISERKRAEDALRKAHDELEMRVRERTAELTSVNERLQIELGERKQAEDALRESEANLADITGSLKEVVWSASPSTLETIYLNAAAEAVYGRPAAEFLANASLWLEVIHPEDRERVTRHVQASSEGDLPELTYRILRPDGEVRWLHGQAHLARDATGHVTRIVGISTDITERKRAEEALRESEERARSIVDTAYDAFISIDGRSVITDWNRHAEVIFGWSREEAVGRTLADTIIPPQLREAHERSLKHFLATGESQILNQRIQLTAVHRDGHEFPVELAVWAVPSGDTYTFNAFVQDITERKRAEEQLQAARAMLEGKVEQQMLSRNPYGLTFRELTVLHLVAAGRSDKEIGVELSISPLTAQKHVSNILTKMGASSRTEATARALRKGLLD